MNVIILLHLHKICVEQYVIAEQLVAVASMHVWAAQLCLSLGIYAQQTLDDYVVDLGPHVWAVDS